MDSLDIPRSLHRSIRIYHIPDFHLMNVRNFLKDYIHTLLLSVYVHGFGRRHTHGLKSGHNDRERDIVAYATQQRQSRQHYKH